MVDNQTESMAHYSARVSQDCARPLSTLPGPLIEKEHKVSFSELLTVPNFIYLSPARNPKLSREEGYFKLPKNKGYFLT